MAGGVNDGVDPLSAWRRVLSRLRGHPSIADAAVEVAELAPADRAETSQAIALPGEIDRAHGAITTMEEQRRWMKRGLLDHGATMAYRLRDAVLAGAVVHTAGVYRDFGTGGWVKAAGPRRTIDTAAQLCGGQGGEHFFGHWLCDDLSTELLAGQRGLKPVTFRSKAWMHEPGYRDLIGTHAEAVSHALFRDLWVVDDRGYNAARVERYRELRRRVRTGADPRRRDGLVFIARGVTGAARTLVNEGEVTALLAQRGFTVIEPERMAPAAIVAALAQADLVVAVEGSAICHGLLALPEGAGIVAIQPPDRVNLFNKIIGDFARLRFGFVVADPAEGGFRIDPARLLRTIELMAR